MFELLKNHYLLSVSAWEPIALECKHSNNFLLTQSDVKKESFLLKKHIKIRSRETLKEIGLILEYLENSEVPVQKIFRTKSGEVAFEFCGFLWTLHEFFPGEFYQGKKKELSQVGKNLALMHKKLAHYYGPTDHLQKRFWTKEDLGCLNDQWVEVQAKKTLSDRSQFESLKSQIIHNDFHPQNVIFFHSDLQAIIDFGNLSVGPVGLDLGQAIHRFARLGQPDEDVKIFLDNYLSVNPLSGLEINSISYFIREGLLRKIISASRREDVFEVGKLIGLLTEVNIIEKSIMNQYASVLA